MKFIGTEPAAEAGIRGWLEAFARAVRARDYAAGAPLFAEDAIGFGTRAFRMDDREHLIAEQWRPTWSSTEGFAFDVDSARAEAAGDLAWVAVTWSSRGFRPDGSAFERVGRATHVLRRREGRWRCVHSHYSLTPPSPEAQAPSA